MKLFSFFGVAAAYSCLFMAATLASGSLVITGIIDGPLAGGLPKAIEVYATDNITDLSFYGLGSANNGEGTDGQEFTFPSVSASAGEFIYVASESTGFTTFLGFSPDYTSAAANINGNDAIELFQNGSVIDVFGDINVDGVGQAWEHTDGWAYRNDNTGPDGTSFSVLSWSFSGVDALDGETSNATAATPFPAGSYSVSGQDNPPTVTSLNPADDAVEVELISDLTVTFNEPVQAGSGIITLHLFVDDSIVETFPLGSPKLSIVGSTVTINPSADLLEATSYYVQLPTGIVEDLGGNPFGGLIGTTAWNFSSDSGSLPPDIAYYTGVIGLTGNTLKVQLEQIIDDHMVIPYGSGPGDGIWGAHADLYEDPNNSNNLILFYSQASIDKSLQDSGSPADYWNREHLWPQSYGVGDSGADYSDLFNLVPAYKGVNSSRNNKYFDYSNPLDFDFADPAYYLSPDCTADSNSWEPANGQKGWVARSMFYMTTRYNYLTLVDSPPEPEPFVDGTFMAQLSVLLEWNRQFLPVLKEQEVNQAVYDNYQGNRNPYIDFPEFADAVFVAGPSWGGWRLEHFTFEELVNPAISSDLADPDFDGIPNIIEMARYSDPRSAEDAPAIVGSASSNQFTVSFVRANDMSNLNLDMEVQVSTDLQQWDPLPLGGATINAVNAEQEEVTLVRTVSPGTAEFYRIIVTRP
jgi:endonuclease I